MLSRLHALGLGPAARNRITRAICPVPGHPVDDIVPAGLCTVGLLLAVDQLGHVPGQDALVANDRGESSGELRARLQYPGRNGGGGHF